MASAGHYSYPTTERKSRLMKWLNKIFKGGDGSSPHGLIGGEQHQQFLEDENMLWRGPSRSVDDQEGSAREQEEVDHAMAMSLAEGFRRPSGRLPNKRGWVQDQDEYLERELRDVGIIPSYPAYPPSYPPYLPAPCHTKGYRMCGGCNFEIEQGNYLKCMEMYFHPTCFRCRACSYPITEHEFSLSGKGPYHKTCFRELTYPKCDICRQFIPKNAAGLIEYRCHPFWLQKYCPSHEYDNTPRCSSCERLETWNTKYIALGDGRSLCCECIESAIMDNGDCQSLYHSIRDYYEGMNMKLDQQIPMLLVERQALNEAIVGEKHGLHHMPETRGLCLSEEQTVTSIKSRPRIGGQRLIGMKTQNQKLHRRCEVTAILVLYGLPRLLTGAILAHELMHGWLRLKGYRNLDHEMEEGICQVLSYMWLESEVMPGFSSTTSISTAASSSLSSSSSSLASSKKGQKSEAEKRLGEFFKHQIAHDTSDAYGGGFRAAYAAVNKYGLRRTLLHMRETGSFPL